MALGRIGQAVDGEPRSPRARSCLKPRGKCRQSRGTLILDEAASRAWIWLGDEPSLRHRYLQPDLKVRDGPGKEVNPLLVRL